MLTLDRFKLYARIDGEDEDELLNALIDAAASAVNDMTGKNPPAGGDELYDMAALQLAAHWYEQRALQATKVGLSDVPFMLQTLLNHISLSDRYPASGSADT